MKPVSEPQGFMRYVDADGKLTQAGMILLKEYFDRLEDHEARIAAIEP